MRQLEAAYSDAEEANEAVRSQRDATKVTPENMDWLAASDDPLFLRKRAETLGQLLDAKRTFQALDWTRGGSSLLDMLIEHPNGLRTLNTAMIEVRKAGLSSQVADVSVCGAVAPTTLLGGKLVALLMASERCATSTEALRRQVSIIARRWPDVPVYRPAELKALTTTSLYGNGSSQYNRLRLQAAHYPVLDHDIAWRELAKTAGYGTVHLGPTTVRVLREVSERMYRARRINNRFGEGASPRLRQIREAVEALGIDAVHVLHHATPRIFYGCGPVRVRLTSLSASTPRPRTVAIPQRDREPMAPALAAEARPERGSAWRSAAGTAQTLGGLLQHDVARPGCERRA